MFNDNITPTLAGHEKTFLFPKVFIQIPNNRIHCSYLCHGFM